MNKYARFRYQPCIPLGEDGRCCTASKKHAQLSRKAATEGMVLLKNENNALPLKKGEKIALFGKATIEYIKGGGGSGDVHTKYIRNIFDGFKEKEKDGKTAVYMPLIDFYKEYNDNYGHQAGDECLIAIARVLKELEKNPGVHVGRYGGDEFMVIYENYPKEKVEGFAVEIKEKITALQVEHKHSRIADHVTVSQGIFLKVPEGANRLWDFTYCADLSLYYVKGKSRNSMFLSTSAKEIKEFAGDDYRLIH